MKHDFLYTRFWQAMSGNFLTALFMTLCLSAPAAAQNRAVPQDREVITLSYAPLVKRVSPSVVTIASKIRVTQNLSPFMADPLFGQLFGGNMGGGGFSRELLESALGSGVIVDPEGLIVTNAHVVRDAAEVKVQLNDGREFTAQKVLVDTPSDLALLKIDTNGQKLPAATLEPTDKLEVGDLVIAIGNPFGVGQTVTSGIVSALARSSLKLNEYNYFIQTDAAINPGNSGGPLVAMDGGVVGINSAIFSRSGGNLGIGFAIPSEMVASIIAAQKAGQSGEHGVTRAWLGIAGQEVTRDIADSLGLKASGGVLVSSLAPASPAKAAGLQVGDVVTAIGGHAVHDPGELKFRMAMVPLGKPADFTVERHGAERTLQVAAIAPPDTPPRDETLLSGNNPLNGVRVANVNPAVAVQLGLTIDSGVVVTATDHAVIGLCSPGDLILAINGQPVQTVRQLQAALAGGQGGWQIVLSHNGEKRQITIR